MFPPLHCFLLLNSQSIRLAAWYHQKQCPQHHETGAGEWKLCRTHFATLPWRINNLRIFMWMMWYKFINLAPYQTHLGFCITLGFERAFGSAIATQTHPGTMGCEMAEPKPMATEKTTAGWLVSARATPIYSACGAVWHRQVNSNENHLLFKTAQMILYHLLTWYLAKAIACYCQLLNVWYPPPGPLARFEAASGLKPPWKLQLKMNPGGPWHTWSTCLGFKLNLTDQGFKHFRPFRQRTSGCQWHIWQLAACWRPYHHALLESPRRALEPDCFTACHSGTLTIQIESIESIERTHQMPSKLIFLVPRRVTTRVLECHDPHLGTHVTKGKRSVILHINFCAWESLESVEMI